MEEHILEKIGKRLREKQAKKKKDRKKSLDKYWKLSAIERLDYDHKAESIKKSTNYPFMWMTITWFKLIIYSFIFFGILGVISGDFFDSLLIIKLITLLVLKFVWIPFIIDCIYWILNDKTRQRQLKELNKRFKL